MRLLEGENKMELTALVRDLCISKIIDNRLIIDRRDKVDGRSWIHTIRPTPGTINIDLQMYHFVKPKDENEEAFLSSTGYLLITPNSPRKYNFYKQKLVCCH